MKRREFITLFGGAAAAWPFAARAQQGERMRRIGVLMSSANDPEGTDPHRGVRAGAAGIGLERRPQRAHRQSLGRKRCRPYRKYAAELVALAPDVILATGGSIVAALLQATRTVPIVFVTAPIRSAAASSRASRGRAATSRVLRAFTNTARAENGWNS